MKKKLNIETKVRRLIHWMDDIEKGFLQIPKFQRNFVWTVDDIRELFDSIKKGYPIGSVLLWKPEEDSFERNEQIAFFTVPDKKNQSSYILDGFQRLSAIFGCLTNPNKTKLECDNKAEWDKTFYVYYDLETEEFVGALTASLAPSQIPVYDLLDTRASFAFEKKLIDKGISAEKIDLYAERYSDVGTIFIDYDLPATTIHGGTIKEAIDIFSRINSKGTQVSSDWMISALSYNRDKDFRLGTLIDDLLEDLKKYNFDTLDNVRDLVVRCITHSLGKPYFEESVKLEELAENKSFILTAEKSIKNIRKTVQFLYEKLLVVEASLLPHSTQIIYMTDFFNTLKNPTENQLQKLKEWFWITAYSSYFTRYTLSRQKLLYKQFQSFLRGESDEIINMERESLSTDNFPESISLEDGRSKALLLFLLHSSHKETENSEIEKRLSIKHLFHNKKNYKNEYAAEGVIPLFDSENINSDREDMSYLLENYEGCYRESYFLTKEMIELCHEDKDEVLSLRKEIIKEAEKKFLKNLGVDYTYDRYASLEEFYKRALEQEPDNPDVIDKYAYYLFDIRGYYSRAAEYYEKALNIRKKLFGENHPDTAKSYNNAGLSLEDTGDPDDVQKGLEFQEKALSIQIKLFGDNHPNTATSYNNVGVSLENTGDVKKGLEYLEKALVIRKKLFGEIHPHTAESYNNIGSSLGKTGKPTDAKKAMEYQEKALTIHKELFGEIHPDTAASYYNVGIFLRKTGDPADAKKGLEYLEKALVIRKKLFGENHPHTALSYHDVAASFYENEQWIKGILYMMKAYAIALFTEYHEQNRFLYDLRYPGNILGLKKWKELVNAAYNELPNDLRDAVDIDAVTGDKS